MGGVGSRSEPGQSAAGRATGRRDRQGGPAGAFLAVAHPGHELLVHGWLCATRPRVVVLTDGSGRSGASRLDATTALLDAAGAPRGALYGRFTDGALYEWILDGDVEVFVSLARELAKELSAEEAELVVGDAAEGYNPIHDAFRLTLNAAVALARRERPALRSYAFPLFGPPSGDASEGALCFPLDVAARDAKRNAARGYAQLEREVEWSLAQYGEEAFGREWLRPVEAAPGEYPLPLLPPVYERYGEHLVGQGELARVIRYEEHLLPIAHALREAAGGA